MSDKDIVENYEKELAKVGLELPQDSESVSDTPEEPKAEPEEPKETVEEPVVPKPEEQNPPSDVPLQEPRKRTVYDDLKEKRKELRSEKELREQAERERDELRAKLEAVQEAGTPQERMDAEDELSEFASEIGADPDAIRRMRELFLKGVQVPQMDSSIKKDMEEFRQWKAQNSVAIEQQMFEQEFQRTIPTLKDLFPSASQEELGVIKKELDVISHSKDWHDKELEYIAFKHKDRLSAFVSPKKRGMETSGRASESVEEQEFDPSADVSSMTPKQRQTWFEEYERATQQKRGIITDASGKKLIV
jgi:hypothetical protein